MGSFRKGTYIQDYLDFRQNPYQSTIITITMKITLITILNDFGKIMGRHSYSNRRTADGARKLEVGFLHKYNYFTPGMQSGTITWTTSGLWGESRNSIGVKSYISDQEKWIQLRYTLTKDSGEKEDIDYKIALTTTPCHYGGERHWFICPLSRKGVPCGRRVGTLYLGNPYFGCRHCLGLTYDSRRTSGIAKTMGVIKSAPEIDEMAAKLRQAHYDGKPTKRYLRYLHECEKFENSMIILAHHLGAFRK